jgi:uncharacterized damage-inducible protein DinB
VSRGTLTGRPAPDEYLAYYERYVALVPDGDLLALLATQGESTLGRVRTLAEDRGGFRYAEGKWTVREVLGHIADVERIFTYRALRIARADTTPIEGFDENAYVAASGADRRPLAALAEELAAVRLATLAFFQSVDDAALARAGTANGAQVTVRALAFIIAGHEAHHVRLLRERYGVG